MPRIKFDRNLIPESPDLRFEATLWGGGAQRVAGLDEAGRGALAGPVAAAAVVLPPALEIQPALSGVRDSKEMAPLEREVWAECIRRESLTFAVGFASSVEIDQLGIVPATRLAMQRALDGLKMPPEHLLVDFLGLPDIPIAQTNLVKGDARSLSIAAASVLAKTARDAYMCELDREFPVYGFAVHKGYATAFHRQKLNEVGPCAVHRQSFAPVRLKAK